MAVTQNTFTPVGYPVPLQGPSTSPRSGTAIPQHALVFNSSQAIAHDVNQQSVSVQFMLPDGYVYLLTDMSCRIACTSAADIALWKSVSEFVLYWQIPSRDLYQQHVPMNSWGSQLLNSGDAYGLTWVPERLPSYPVEPSQVTLAQWSLMSSAALAADYAMNAFARFLAFDKQQYQNWPLHTPAIALR